MIIYFIPVYTAYIILIGALMFRRRFHAIKSGQIDFKHFKSYQTEAPRELQVIQNHYSNQFEIPVLFMLTCLCAFVLQVSSTGLVICGFLFCISRVIHSFIHLGKNNIQRRALAYAIGILIVLAMWAQILLKPSVQLLL